MDAVIVDAERLLEGFALPAVVQSEPKILTLEWWMTTARIVLTTIGKQQDAEKLALQLVERRLAACVNIVGPIRSVYRWKQKISNEPEYLLVIKTTAELAAQLHSAFKQLHPYELPECVELAVQGGSDDYLAWLAGEVSG
jgi:periplasmic divalent cation tolerance protein